MIIRGRGVQAVTKCDGIRNDMVQGAAVLEVKYTKTEHLFIFHSGKLYIESLSVY